MESSAGLPPALGDLARQTPAAEWRRVGASFVSHRSPTDRPALPPRGPSGSRLPIPTPGPRGPESPTGNARPPALAHAVELQFRAAL